MNDAYEEVDEQRQVAGQWKRKAQKIQGEMNDIRLLLEEQTSRNALLEKKQRKFDSELGLVNRNLREMITTRLSFNGDICRPMMIRGRRCWPKRSCRRNTTA